MATGPTGSQGKEGSRSGRVLALVLVAILLSMPSCKPRELSKPAAPTVVSPELERDLAELIGVLDGLFHLLDPIWNPFAPLPPDHVLGVPPETFPLSAIEVLRPRSSEMLVFTAGQTLDQSFRVWLGWMDDPRLVRGVLPLEAVLELRPSAPLRVALELAPGLSSLLGNPSPDLTADPALRPHEVELSHMPDMMIITDYRDMPVDEFLPRILPFLD